MKRFLPLLFIIQLLLLGCNNTDKQNLLSFDGMVLIPAGQFIMGAKSEEAYYDEFPRHEVRVSSFLMDDSEVTNLEFQQFVEATGYVTIAERDINWENMKAQINPGTPKPPDSLLQAGSLVFMQTEGDVNLNDYSQWWEWTIGANWRNPMGPGSSIKDRMNHPVVHVAWIDALVYAEWAGKRLPTEAEWEWAAMGGIENAKYPWGNEPVYLSYDKANFWQGSFPYKNIELDGFYRTAPVKSFPKNGYGLYDVAGNVWEWCMDKYDTSHYKKEKEKGCILNPKGSSVYFDPQEPYNAKHILRGGSFLCNDSYCSGYRVARRMSLGKDSSSDHIGFRCVKDIIHSKSSFSNT